MPTPVLPKVSRVKLAVAIAKLSSSPIREKQASSKRLLKVAQRFFKGQPLLPALKAEYPGVDDKNLKLAAVRIIQMGLKQATYPGCHGPKMRKKKPVKKANHNTLETIERFAPEIGHAGAGMMMAGPALSTGALAGGTAGTILGAARGDAVEGLGRGVIRGGSTTGGMLGGGLLGSYLGTRLGLSREAIAALIAGGGLTGGAAGYLGSGAMLGPPKAGKREFDVNINNKAANAYCNAPASQTPSAAPSMSLQGPASNFSSMMSQAGSSPAQPAAF